MNTSRTSGALPLQTHTLLILQPADECPPLSLGHCGVTASWSLKTIILKHGSGSVVL